MHSSIPFSLYLWIHFFFFLIYVMPGAFLHLIFFQLTILFRFQSINCASCSICYWLLELTHENQSPWPFYPGDKLGMISTCIFFPHATILKLIPTCILHIFADRRQSKSCNSTATKAFSTECGIVVAPLAVSLPFRSVGPALHNNVVSIEYIAVPVGNTSHSLSCCQQHM